MDILGVELSELELSQIGSWPKLLRFFLLGLASILTIVAGYFLDLETKFERYKSAQSNIREKKKLFADSQLKAANLESYKREIAIVKAKLDTLSEQLPKQNELAGFLDDASQQAGLTGLKFLAIQPMRSVDKKFYWETEVVLKLSGDYQAFGAFASNVANMRRIVTMHDFEIKKADSSNNSLDKSQLLIDVVSKTYWSVGD